MVDGEGGKVITAGIPLLGVGKIPGIDGRVDVVPPVFDGLENNDNIPLLFVVNATGITTIITTAMINP